MKAPKQRRAPAARPQEIIDAALALENFEKVQQINMRLESDIKRIVLESKDEIFQSECL